MYLIRLQTEGICTVSVNGRKKHLQRGDLLLLKPGDIYALSVGNRGAKGEKPDQPSGDYHLLCESDWVREWWAHSPKPETSHIHVNDTLINLWRLLIVEKRRNSFEKNNEDVLDYLLRALCLTLDRSVRESEDPSRYPGAVVRMLRYIEEHAISSLSVDEVARHAGCSPSRAAHLFKSGLGKTIMGYAQEIRLAEAMEQMKYTSLTLEQIAQSSGFGTYSYFHKIFKRNYGVAPGIFRKGE